VGLGLSLNPGESLWAPKIRTPVDAVAVAGTTHAMAAPSRTTTNFPPAGAGHPAASSRRVKPDSSRRRATSAAAWKLDGDAATNPARSSACPRAPVMAEAVGDGTGEPPRRR
jgi:hypothetical protein